MTSSIDLLRLTIPEPTGAPVRLDNALSIKNWSVGTLLDAIIVSDQNGKLAAQILRDGIAQTPNLPLPDYASLKSGESLVLKVTQLQPQVQLQIVQKPTNNKLDASPALLTTNRKATATTVIDNSMAKSTLPLNQMELANTLATSTDFSAQKKWQFALSTQNIITPSSSSSTPMAKTMDTRLQTFNDVATTIESKSVSLPINSAPSLNNNRDRALFLAQTLAPISKTIWPQQRELRAVLPVLIPALKNLTRDEQMQFIAKAFQWPDNVKAATEQLLQSIPNATQLIEGDEKSLPKPLRQWFRQWLQHRIDEAPETTSNDDDVNTPTASATKQTLPLVQLIRQILIGAEDVVDLESEAISKLSPNISSALKNEAPEALPPKTPLPRVEINEKFNVSNAKNDLLELETLLQTVATRLQHHTLNSLQAESRGTPQWNAELPVLFQQRVDVFDLMIEADRQQEKGADREAPPNYVIRLRFDLPELGPCQFIVQLRGSDVDINVYSERDNTQQQFAQSFDVLAQWLANDELHLNACDSFTITNLAERMR